MKTPEYEKALDLALKVRAEKHAEVAASIILSALREAQPSGQEKPTWTDEERLMSYPVTFREAQPSEEEKWYPQFAGGDAWRIGGSKCSYGYMKQQAEEICDAHNASLSQQPSEDTERLVDDAATEIAKLFEPERIFVGPGIFHPMKRIIREAIDAARGKEGK